MAFNNWPYTNFQDLNLGWILSKIKNSEDAKSIAESASTTANQASATANAASTTANQASTTANQASATANAASTTANQASSTANQASSTANQASSNAQQALTTAQQALNMVSNTDEILFIYQTSDNKAIDYVDFVNGTTTYISALNVYNAMLVDKRVPLFMDRNTCFFTLTGITTSPDNPLNLVSVEFGHTNANGAYTISIDRDSNVTRTFEPSDGGGGLTEEAKRALLACFQNVAWTTEDSQTYYDALEDALYPPANLVSISAVFNQGSAVIYDTDTLDTLKQYLTVTAHYDNSTTQTVSNYTLSGTLTVGTSTITVLYGGKSTTFTVVVSHEANGLVDGDYTNEGATIRVENNRISGVNAMNYRSYTIPFKTSISLHAGDVVSFVPKNVTQDSTNNNALNIGFNDEYISDGDYFCPFRSSPTSKTVTLATNINAESLRLGALDAMNGRSFELSITVNGEEVFA